MMAFGGNKEGVLQRGNFRQYIRSYALVIIFLGVCAIFAIASPTFLSPTNIVGVFRQIAINGVLALGMTLVIITGGIDLSEMCIRDRYRRSKELNKEACYERKIADRR